MKRRFLVTALFTCALFSAGAFAQSKNLDIYWIDTEGGGATLIVTPDGESLLVDTGNPSPENRDANRIFEVTKLAGLKKIDYLVTTHFHADHAGGAPALNKMIPIGRFFDHGDSIEGKEGRGKDLWEAYEAVARGKRTTLKPGDKLPLKGVESLVVSANGQTLASPVKGGGPNSFCTGAAQKPADTTENQRSVAFLLTYGKFKFADFGDLTWDKEMELSCPTNKLGTVTLFQATHHGFVNDYSGAPANVLALKPQVMVVNNGPTKGWQNSAWETTAKLQGLEDVWQLHKAMGPNHDHNVEDARITNLEPTAECKGHWVKASVARDGKFTLTNGRNGFSKTYTAR